MPTTKKSSPKSSSARKSSSAKKSGSVARAKSFAARHKKALAASALALALLGGGAAAYRNKKQIGYGASSLKFRVKNLFKKKESGPLTRHEAAAQEYMKHLK